MMADDFLWRSSHYVNMEQPAGPDWFLHEWFATAGLKQHDLVTKLDYGKNTASRLWHGLQPFRRDHVQDISALLNIKPYELLMHPEEAFKLRRLEAALKEVAREEAPAAAETADKKPSGRAAA